MLDVGIGARIAERVRKPPRGAPGRCSTLSAAVLLLVSLAEIVRFGNAISAERSSLQGMDYVLRGRDAKMQDENNAAWMHAHDIVLPSNVPSQAVVHTSNVSLFATDRCRAAPNLGTMCVGTSGGTGVTSGGGGGGGGSNYHRCTCTREFETERALMRHQQRMGCIGGRVKRPAPPLNKHQRAAQEQAADDCGETERNRIQQEQLLSTAELHYEHHAPKATIQRGCDAARDVAALQSKAIKKALRGKVKEGVSLDALIDPIMQASHAYRGKRAWKTGIAKVTSDYEVRPVRRQLCAASPDQEELFMYDVPIEQSLEREAQYNPAFAQYLVDWGERPSLPGGQYGSINDGTASREHPELGNPNYNGPARLAFCYYYDDVEVVNPIGTARTKHKLALHYAQLLNTPPDVCSELDTVFLVAVVLSSTQHDVGISTVVQGPRSEPMDGSSFGASMRRFHRGISIQLELGATAAPTPFRGWLLVAAADALAAVDLVGFAQSFGPKSKCICWQCDAAGANHKCAYNFLDDVPIIGSKFQLRTKAVYASDRQRCCALPEKAKEAAMKRIGVKTFNHAFTRIPYVCGVETLPKDLMHVELEGNLKVHLYGFLYMAIRKYNWFTLKMFNAAVKAFDFDGEQRPPPITTRQLRGCRGGMPRRDGTVVMTAGQMLAFALASVEIFRPLLPAAAFASNEYAAWVAHIHYFQLLMARRFSDASIATLAAAIKTAQDLFLSITGYRTYLWKPKNHFAQHFPVDTKRFGPPRNYWCMRFEAKNQEHKRAAKMGRFRDVPGLVANFWAKRSHLRLIRKRTAGGVCDDVEEPMRKAMRYIRHPEAPDGTWIRVEKVGRPAYIAYVESHSTSDSGVPVLHVFAFDAASILHEAADGPYALRTELTAPTPTTSISLNDPNVVIVRLRLCEGGDGKVRFVYRA